MKPYTISDDMHASDMTVEEFLQSGGHFKVDLTVGDHEFLVDRGKQAVYSGLSAYLMVL